MLPSCDNARPPSLASPICLSCTCPRPLWDRIVQPAAFHAKSHLALPAHLIVHRPLLLPTPDRGGRSGHRSRQERDLGRRQVRHALRPRPRRIPGSCCPILPVRGRLRQAAGPSLRAPARGAESLRARACAGAGGRRGPDGRGGEAVPGPLRDQPTFGRAAPLERHHPPLGTILLACYLAVCGGGGASPVCLDSSFCPRHLGSLGQAKRVGTRRRSLPPSIHPSLFSDIPTFAVNLRPKRAQPVGYKYGGIGHGRSNGFRPLAFSQRLANRIQRLKT